MDHTRHSGLYTIPQFDTFSLVGCGGIGSITAVTLAKMGVRYLDLYDGDLVEPINIATQLHPVSAAGNHKVSSTGDLCAMFSDDVMISLYPEIVSGTHQFHDQTNVIISAVDGLNARKDIWRAVCQSDAQWYIDARMSAQVFQMYVVDLRDYPTASRYQTELLAVNEADVPDVVCTEKATFFTACIAAGHIGAAVKRIYAPAEGTRISYRLVHYIAKNVLYEFNL